MKDPIQTNARPQQVINTQGLPVMTFMFGLLVLLVGSEYIGMPIL